MSTPNYDKAVALASAKLSQYKVSDPVVPVAEIAEAEGLAIKVIMMPDKLKNASGFFDADSKTIYVNAEDVAARQRFTIAHELGHYLMSHDPSKYGVLLRFPELNGDDDNEKEANCFAANLLVPKIVLRDIMRQYSLGENDLPVLSQLFGVSRSVIKFRLKHI